MEAIVGSIPAGVVVIEKENGKIVYVNERAVALYGCDISDFESPSRTTKLIRLLTLDGHIYPPQQLPAKKALLTGRETKDELIIEKPDGSRIVVAISAKPVKNEKGQISAAVAVFEDITERKKSEETLSQYTTNLELIVEHRTSQLTLERKRFFSMLEDLPVMVCLITAVLKELYFGLCICCISGFWRANFWLKLEIGSNTTRH